MLTKVFEPAGVEIVFADFDDPGAVAAAIAEHRPGADRDGDHRQPAAARPARSTRSRRMAREANVP